MVGGGSDRFLIRVRVMLAVLVVLSISAAHCRLADFLAAAATLGPPGRLQDVVAAIVSIAVNDDPTRHLEG